MIPNGVLASMRSSARPYKQIPMAIRLDSTIRKFLTGQLVFKVVRLLVVPILVLFLTNWLLYAWVPRWVPISVREYFTAPFADVLAALMFAAVIPFLWGSIWVARYARSFVALTVASALPISLVLDPGRFGWQACLVYSLLASVVLSAYLHLLRAIFSASTGRLSDEVIAHLCEEAFDPSTDGSRWWMDEAEALERESTIGAIVSALALAVLVGVLSWQFFMASFAASTGVAALALLMSGTTIGLVRYAGLAQARREEETRARNESSE